MANLVISSFPHFEKVRLTRRGQKNQPKFWKVLVTLRWSRRAFPKERGDLNAFVRCDADPEEDQQRRACAEDNEP